MPRPRKIIVPKYLSDDQVASLEGKWIDESYMKFPVIDYNCDVYYKDDDGTEKLLLKFRKNSISTNLLRTGWQSYKDLAKPSRGRGASAGPIDKEGVYWKKRNIVNTGKWSTGYLTPDGNKMKEELDKLSIEELKEKVKESDIQYKSEDINYKDYIKNIYNIIFSVSLSKNKSK